MITIETNALRTNTDRIASAALGRPTSSTEAGRMGVEVVVFTAADAALVRDALLEAGYAASIVK